MSKEKNNTNEIEEMEELEESEEEESQIDLITSVLDKLVPPSEILIEDIYGNKYELRTKIPARSQIKLLRKFEEVTEEIKLSDFFSLDEEINSRTMIRAIMKMATKEEVMNGIEICFGIAHPLALKNAISEAKSDEYAPKKPKALDLFSLEDTLSAILPLFLGLIKKGATTLTLLAQ